jgi:hypothetical protein
MEKSTWKVLFIIILVLFVLENSLIVWGAVSNNKLEKETNICYYDVCEDYPNAYYDSSNKVCDCYESDLMGNEVIAKSEYMGRR